KVKQRVENQLSAGFQGVSKKQLIEQPSSINTKQLSGLIFHLHPQLAYLQSYQFGCPYLVMLSIY
ncbi:hypothetical protein, partial [Pasteurella oralis]|uniref:hypothetical protein n=1 Tax=Pasteurella oralis TaxID=1071947 RepID=UPI001C2CA267